MFEFFRRLIASDSPQSQDFNIVDPTAIGDEVRIISLAITPPSELSSSTDISLYWKESNQKLFEKKFKNNPEAEETYAALLSDLAEVSQLTKEAKMDEAKHLVSSLLDKYAVHTDTIVDITVAPKTTTNAAQDIENPEEDNESFINWFNTFLEEKNLPHESWEIQDNQGEINFIDSDVVIEAIQGAPELEQKQIKDMIVKLDFKNANINDYFKHLAKGLIDTRASKKSLSKKEGKATVQNIFFDSPEELMEYQDKMKQLQPEETKGPGALDDKFPSKKMPGGLDDEEIGPPSVSYEDAEEQEADEAKDLSKRIEEAAKAAVDDKISAKIATRFSDKDKELVEALRGVGRTDAEIIDYMTKNLKYEKEAVTAFMDELNGESESLLPDSPLDTTKEPMEEEDPMAPKPPENLVSPETHEKLLDELEEPTEELEIEKLEPELEIAKLDGEISKKADDPLETRPRPSRTEDQFPPTDFDVPNVSEDMVEDKAPLPDEGHVDNFQRGDRVYISGDYETGETGFEATYVDEYATQGDDFVTVETDDGELLENIPKYRLTKASIHNKMVKIAQARHRLAKKRLSLKPIKKSKAQKELSSIALELVALHMAEELLKTSDYIDDIVDPDPDEFRQWSETAKPEMEQDEKEIAELNALIDNWMNVLNDISSPYVIDLMRSRIKEVQTLIDEKLASKKDKVTKKAANPKVMPQPQPKPKTDPKDNIDYQKMKNAPPGKRVEDVETATPDVIKAYEEVQVVQKNIESIELNVKKILQTAKEEIQKYEHDIGKKEEVAQKQELVNNLGRMVEAIKSQNVRIGNDIISYMEKTKTQEVKWNSTQISNWLGKKFPEVHRKLQQALAGAQKDAKETTTKELRQYPAVPGDRGAGMLSKFDKQAGFLDTLEEVYLDLKDALNMMLQAPIETTAKRKQIRLKKKAKFKKNAKELKLWDSGPDYLGEEYPDYYMGPVRNRDSEHLEESNFNVALNQLGGEGDGVMVQRAGHWAVGWVEVILVHKDASEKVEILQNIVDQIESYPVLDEEDYSQREQEGYKEAIDDWAFDEAVGIMGFNVEEMSDQQKGDLSLAIEDTFRYYGELFVDPKVLKEHYEDALASHKSMEEYEKGKESENPTASKKSTGE